MNRPSILMRRLVITVAVLGCTIPIVNAIIYAIAAFGPKWDIWGLGNALLIMCVCIPVLLASLPLGLVGAVASFSARRSQYLRSAGTVLFIANLAVCVAAFVPSSQCLTRRNANRTRVRIQVPFQRLQQACLEYANTNSGTFPPNLLSVLDAKQWRTTILRDPRSRQPPPQIWPNGWTAPFDYLSKVPIERRNEVISKVQSESDIRYLGQGLTTNLLAKAGVDSCILLYNSTPLKQHGFLVGYIAGGIDWIPESKLQDALTQTESIRKSLGLEPPHTGTHSE